MLRCKSKCKVTLVMMARLLRVFRTLIAPADARGPLKARVESSPTYEHHPGTAVKIGCPTGRRALRFGTASPIHHHGPDSIGPTSDPPWPPLPTVMCLHGSMDGSENNRPVLNTRQTALAQKGGSQVPDHSVVPSQSPDTQILRARRLPAPCHSSLSLRTFHTSAICTEQQTRTNPVSLQQSSGAVEE